MKKLAVIGPGLLGGSIALALRQQPGWTTALWARRPEAVGEIFALQMADVASNDLAEVVSEAHVVVLCTPVGAMAELARQMLPALAPTALVTDVGSVKANVVAELAPIFREKARFVGSHPMAGSEKTGIQAAKADLFKGSVCMVTPTAEVAPETVREVSDFWQLLGCRVAQMGPEEHDETVALVSHLAHVAAAAMVNAVADRRPEALDFAGPGFRDTTRVAGGAPEMWTEILRENRAAVRHSIEAMIEKLQAFGTLLDRSAPGDERAMNEFLTQAKLVRDRLRLPMN